MKKLPTVNAAVPGEPIAIVTDYIGLQRVMRERLDALKMSRLVFEEIADLNEGHASKMLRDPPAKNMGITTLGKLLGGLGLKLLVVEDAEQTAQLRTRITERNEAQVRWKKMQDDGLHDEIELRISRRTMRRIGIIGGRKRWEGISKRARRRIAQRAARVRWKSGC